jgi:hypothetical protein
VTIPRLAFNVEALSTLLSTLLLPEHPPQQPVRAKARAKEVYYGFGDASGCCGFGATG